jgi:subtilisin family serine protease
MYLLDTQLLTKLQSMKNQITFFKLFMVMLLILGVNLMSSSAQEFKDGVLQGTFRVKLKPAIGEAVKLTTAADGQTIQTGIQALDNLNTKHSVVNMKRVFKYSPKHENKLQKHGLHLWYEVQFIGTQSTKSVVNEYDNLDLTEISEPIFEKVLINPGTPRKVEIPNVKSTKAEPFNDPYLPKQWHYNNTGQTGGTPGADINLYEAWNITTGSSNVIVSIHDMGVDYEHEDLHENMWVNEAELNGEPNVDDDGNGYKDDVYGFNFADNMGQISPHYHGTHVAGTIGAMNNNGLGVAGVAGGTDTEAGVRMMTCQILGGVSQGNLPDSYVYAANNGAIISQNSWGYTSTGFIEQSILDGIDYFIEEAGDYDGSPMKGGVVIFAAGNSNYDGEWWPGYYENVIAVSALSANNVKASYSNYGTWVDIGAPGGEYTDDTSLPEGQEDAGYSNSVLSTFDNNSYGYLDGTSMACPHVSGIAALVISKYGNADFTAEDLKAHLLTGVNDIDTVTENANYIGKLGLGATDAVLALGNDNSISPEAVTDLAINGMAQNFAILEWAVPADSDDDRPYSFEILHSKEVITLGTLEFAISKTIKNDNLVGETVSFEVEGLDALTDYYFSVRSIDRWGNVSDFSNEVTATTNEGPDAWVDKSDFDFKKIYIGYDPVQGYMYDTIWYTPNNIDVLADVNGSTDFYLHNSGAGVLRWDLEARHVESIDASSVSRIKYPDIKEPGAGFKAEIKSVNAPILPIQTFAQEDNDEFMEHISPWGSLWLIGETDTSFTNSAATHFVVDNPEGFNLTHAEIFLNYESSQLNPAIFEIYLGEEINNAKLTYAQELTSTKFGWNYFNLEEQIYLENGTHFWMVIHIPSGNLYPLGAGIELEQEDSKNCYMSLNMGKSWQMFEDLYYNNLLAWAMTAVSKYKTPGDIITLSPLSGEVVTNDSIQIAASVDASEMINGTYKTSVIINTNEVEEPMLRANVWTKVEGQKAIIDGEKLVDFGSVIFGKEKLVDITLTNDGYGKFKYPKPTISDPQFEIIGSLSTINPRSEYTFQMLYTPSGIGNANAKVTIYNNYGDEFVFNVFGVGAEPPVMEMTPDSTSFMGLAIGDTVTGEFYVKNTGNYPLNYYFPAFATGENVGEVEGDFCKFGYSSKKNPGGVFSDPAFVWTDISATGTDLTGYSTEKNYFYYDVELGFNFPFFGKMENHVYITNYGMVSFDQNSSFNISPLHYKDKWDYLPNRYISALGTPHNLAIQGNIYYQDLGDRFIIQYDKVNYLTYDANWEQINLSFTYQIVLHANGNINIYYKDMDGVDANTLVNSTLIAIEDKNDDDGLCVSQSQYYGNQILLITDLTVAEFINPGLGLIYEMTNAEGIVQPNDSVKVSYSAKTDILNVDDYLEKIPLLSNDPFNNPGIYTMYFNITSGGTPDLHLSDTAYNFGQVFEGDSLAFNLWVTNAGRANDTITSVVFNNGYFTATGDIPAVSAPSRKMLYSVAAISSTLGTFEDTLTLTTALGEVLEVALSAEIIVAPQISSNISSVTDTIVSGNSVTKTLTLTNSGGNDLEFAPIGNDWVTVSEPAVKANVIPEYTYTFTKSTEVNGPQYNWIDIVETGTRLDSIDAWPGYSGGDLTYWSNGIELPFTFNFYGNEYDTLYIGFNGVMSFTEDDPDASYPFGGTNLPNSDAPNNLIAPLWSFAYGDGVVYDDWGVYYQEYSDKIVVEWHRFTDGFYMGYGISWEAIIYADGNIKFQYNFGGNTEQFLSSNGIIGLENEEGTEATVVQYNTYGFLSDELAISFNPIRKYTVATGTSEDYDLIINAKELYAGDYTYDLELLNNTPDMGNLTIPVNLNVTGEANINTVTNIDFGDVMVYDFVNDWGSTQQMSYTEEFEVSNNGSDKGEIFAFDFSKLTATTVEAYVLVDGWFGPAWEWWNVMNLPVFDWNCGCNTPLYIEPNSAIQFRATITPTTADAVRDTIVISTDYASNPDFQITFTADPMLPPVASISDEEINVYAETATHTETRTFYLSNDSVSSDLNYNLEIAYIRDIDNSATAKYSAKTESIVPELKGKAISTDVKNTKSSSTKYNRVLEYETATAAETLLGYGGSAMFLTGTKFTAPADGFNLTHVQSWYTPGDWLNSKIIVEIMSGDPMLENSSVIYTQEFEHNISTPDAVGSFITIELDQNKIFFPGEDFFVVFKYPTGAAYPQGVATVSEQVTGRFCYGNGEVWSDIIGSGYDTFGWMVKAIENEFASSVWVELASSLSGSVTSGDSIGIDLSFIAAYANNGINEAKVTITTNDPYKSNINVPVYLHKNEGPRFDLGADITLAVNENETLNLDIEAIDLEGDNYTLAMDATYEFVTESFNAGVLSFTYTPDYDSDGMHAFVVNGEDELGNTTEFTINVGVVNVNRAPQSLDLGTIELFENGNNYFIQISDLFTDADGDVLEITSLTIADNNISNVYESGTEYVVIPGIAGITTVKFDVVDIYGATATNTITINVSPSTGVEDMLSENIQVYPNPTDGDVYISLPEDLNSELTITVINAVGATIKKVKVNSYIINSVLINIDEQPAGLYFIQIADTEVIKSEKIIKK